MGISDDSIRLTLRLPESIRDQLLKRSRKNLRSMNSEILAILEDGLKTSSTSQINENSGDYKTAAEISTLKELPDDYQAALELLIDGLSKKSL